MNKSIILGNLTKDIELKILSSGVACATSSIAVSYKYKSNNETKEEVCFIDIVIFNKMAEIANQYLNKGSKVLIDGRLKFEQWDAQDGTKRSKHIIVVNEIKFLDSKTPSDQQDSSQTSNNNDIPF
jgi:single-strand DNA-binding protein